MIIPEDGNLPKITRKGFAAFNNIMLIRVPDKFKKPGETTYQFATLDRSKKGERWPADAYVDMLNSLPLNETNSAENSSKCKEDAKKVTTRKYGKFLPKKFPKNFSKKDQKVSSSTPPLSPDTANSKHHFMPNAFQDSKVSHRRFHSGNHFQYDERNFNDTAHNYRHRPNKFSNDHPSYGRRESGEGTSLNSFANRYGSQSHTVSATVSRNPPIRDRSYDGDFPSTFPSTFAPNPRENHFHIPEISNPNFSLAGRNSDEYFVQNVPNTFERQMFPSYNSNRPEFMNNNNFEIQPFLCDPMGPGLNAGNNPPPLLPHPTLPPYDNFNDGQFQNNFDGRKPHHDQNSWKNHNPHFRRKGRNQRMHKKPWRGGAHNKFSKGNNNRRDNRYERKELS
uniref:Uncharacterized protein n=1 Tax=Parasteatoda tepidariorum TaxID=114398 RepID=A0A2L2YFV9_PARTP